jgi:hypothetical protein
VTRHLRAFLGADEATLNDRLTHDGPVDAVLAAIGHRLSGPAVAALAAELTAAAGGLLEEELGAILLAGLMTYQGLIDAGRETIADEDLTVLVTLDDHLVRVVHEPHIDVHADRRRVYELRLTLSVAFTVQGLAATVRAGRLIHVRIGRCTAEVALSWQQGSLLENSDLVEAPLVIRLGCGVPIPQAFESQAQVRGTARVAHSPSGAA